MATAPSKLDSDRLDERTKPPFLRRVRIRGYKSIAFCDVVLQPLTILVGRNAAGKSNFLDALAFLRDAMETSVTEAVKRRGGWTSVAHRVSKTQKIDFEIETNFTCGRPYRRVNGRGSPATVPSRPEEASDLEEVPFVAKYSLELSAEPNSILSISRESLEITDSTNHLRAGFEVQGGIIERWRTTSESAEPIDIPPSHQLFSMYRPDRPLLSVIGTQPFIDLGEGLRTIGCYNFSPELIRLSQAPNHGWILEKNGRNLASVLESLKEIDPDALQRIREYLSTIVEEVADFEVARSGEYETVRFLLKTSSTGSPVEFDAASMSDGTLRALAGIVAAFQIVLPYGYPSVIGIEEPETSLHPAATHALVDALQEATEHTQVLLTTHSGDLLSDPDLKPSQILVVRNRDGETQIAPIDAASREIVHKELYTLADLHRMDQLELDAADLVRQDKLRTLYGEG